MANPYIVGALNFDRHDQYYRSSPTVEDVLESGNPLVRITGARKIGKSWFLQWIQETAPRDRYVAVRLMLAAIPDMTTFVQFLWEELPEPVQGACPTAEGFARAGNLNRFLRTIDDVLRDQDRRLVLLLDEEEAFSGWAREDRDVLTRLRDAFHSNPRVRVVLAVSQLFSRDLRPLLAGPSTLIGHFVEVSPLLAELDDPDADRLIRQVHLSRPVRVEDDLCARIRELTNNQPYLLQLVCHGLYDETAHRLRPFEALFHAGDGRFRDIYQRAHDAHVLDEAIAMLTDLEKAVVLDIAAGSLGDARRLSEPEHEAVAELRRFGYIRATESAHQPYAPAHGLWRRWFEVRGEQERQKLVPWPRTAPSPTPFIQFDLPLRRVGTRHWEVACLDSPAGQSHQPVIVPARLSPAARRARGDLHKRSADQLRENAGFGQLGQELGNILLPASVGASGSPRELLLESLDMVSARTPAAGPQPVLRIRLRLWPDSAQDYPWETACCAVVSPASLATHPRLSLVRFVPLPRPCEIPARTEPLRILLAHADTPPASGLCSLDYTTEWDAIKREMQPALRAGRVQMVPELVQATEAALRQRLASDRPHVVHLVAHGEPGIVYLHGDALGHGHTSAQMADIFRDSVRDGIVRLVVLNICHSVQVGHALAAAGVPGVVAMQGIPSDQFAVRFSGNLYHFLSQGLSLDEALRRTRDALVVWSDAAQPPAGWCVPVLYSRIAEGCV